MWDSTQTDHVSFPRFPTSLATKSPVRVWPVDGGTRSLRTSVAFDLLAGLKSIERFIFVLGSFHVRSTFSRENVSKPFFAAVVVQDDGWDVFYEWEVFFCLECSIRNPENAFIAFPIQNDSNTSMIFHVHQSQVLGFADQSKSTEGSSNASWSTRCSPEVVEPSDPEWLKNIGSSCLMLLVWLLEHARTKDLYVCRWLQTFAK